MADCSAEVLVHSSQHAGYCLTCYAGLTLLVALSSSAADSHDSPIIGKGKGDTFFIPTRGGQVLAYLHNLEITFLIDIQAATS